MNLVKLQPEEIRMVYETCMRNDFPASELKPLKNIEEMYKRGEYECLGYYEGGKLRGYAYMVLDHEKGYLLLDYLAACKENRGQGYGSRILKELRTCFCTWNGIFIESEALRSSAGQEELRMRRRRLNFYLKNGCILTDNKTLVYGVEYSIFYIPLQMKEPDYEKCLDHVYCTMFSEKAMKNHVRAWRISSRLNYVGKSKEPDSLEECSSLMSALDLSAEYLPRLIAFTGAGGKTTSMFELADELAESGKRVLVTTSTHFQSLRPEGAAFIERSSDITEKSWTSRILTAGWTCETGQEKLLRPKLSMPEGLDKPEEIRRLLDLCDVILYEADGAKRCPLKVPGKHEPVILEGTELVIGCAGLHAMGKTYADGCFRFLTDGAWLRSHGENRIQGTDRITPDTVAQILSDERGTRKNVACDYKIILNQADQICEIQKALQIIGYLPEKLKNQCIVTSYQKEQGETV